MTKAQNSKLYDLEERCFKFAKDVRLWVKLLPNTMSNREDAPQLIRSSGSIGANYIEANEALSKKDFVFRIRISRKEAKESRYWLNLLDIGQAAPVAKEHHRLIQEATELMMIMSSIMRKSQLSV
jgi:four helix bundle protein